MCWITIRPFSRHWPHRHGHHHTQHHHHRHPTAVTEELVRIRRDTPPKHCAHILLPEASPAVCESKVHSMRLHGHGSRRRPPLPPPPPPPPSRCSIRQGERERVRVTVSHVTSAAAHVPEPQYRTVIATPKCVSGRDGVTIQRSTRDALCKPGDYTGPRRSRVRRMAGCEVLSRQLPWSWDCISSEGSEEKTRKEKDKLNYPPFGSASSWM